MMATCYDCFHCDACNDTGDSGFSCLKEDVSRCKHFVHSADVVDRIDVIAICDIEGITPTKLHDWEFGKNVFLTQEEAEKAVKIMEGE